MAANKATITVNASVLPDNVKRSISGTAVYNLNDVGDDNKWVMYVNSVDTSAQACIPDGVGYYTNDSGDQIATTDSDVDDLGLILIKHTGFQGDGTSKTTVNAKLYINVEHNKEASGGAEDMYLLPGELWWGRFVHSDLADISLEASVGTINVEIYAVVDDGGVS